MSALLGAGIGAGANLIGGIIQNRQNQNNAQQQQDWNLEQWNRQNTRDDSLWNKQNAYNLDMWNKQNQFNSPQAQMARFKEAGLNPHLIYGKGTPGNATPINSNAQRTMDVKGYNRAEAQNVTRGMDVYGQYVQFKNMEAQTDNLRQDQINKEQQRILATQQEILNNIGIHKAKRENSLGDQTFQNQLDASTASLRQQQQNIRLQSQQLGLNEFELGLNKKGLTRTDSKWERMGSTIWDKEKQNVKAWGGHFMDSGELMYKGISKGIRNYYNNL